MRSTVKIEFDIDSASSWVLGLLDNENILTDLADRTAREFARDLAKMNTFSVEDLEVTLRACKASRDFSHRKRNVFI